MKRLIQAAGMKHATPHSFRHNFATSLVHKGVPVHYSKRSEG
ncbi:MAG: tyrosine-type recombinase/integrase [Candidatus Abyssubacteria bacterium]|nr:tyrosine-type recombinase/integrase [Candidatus Abyssubacteria bacterium]